MPATIFLTFPFYRPTAYAQDVKAPVLLFIAEKDSLCPVHGVRAMAKKISNVTIEVLDIGHFDPYINYFDTVVEKEISFFKKHL